MTEAAPKPNRFIRTIQDETRNATIEECAKAADSYGGREGREIAVVIRALKDKP